MTPEEAISVSPKRLQIDVIVAEWRALRLMRRNHREGLESIAREQIEYWRENRVSASEAWKMLTGKDQAITAWHRVEAWMIRWLLRKREDEGGMTAIRDRRAYDRARYLEIRNDPKRWARRKKQVNKARNAWRRARGNG